MVWCILNEPIGVSIQRLKNPITSFNHKKMEISCKCLNWESSVSADFCFWKIPKVSSSLLIIIYNTARLSKGLRQDLILIYIIPSVMPMVIIYDGRPSLKDAIFFSFEALLKRFSYAKKSSYIKNVLLFIQPESYSSKLILFIRIVNAQEGKNNSFVL